MSSVDSLTPSASNSAALDIDKRRILIIDDDVNFLEMMQDLLLDTFDIAVAEDAFYGADLLMSERYDLVILDQQMPVMSGAEFLDLLERANRFKNVPVLICSGGSRPQMKLTGAFPRSFLAKPFDRAQLMEEIRRLLDRPVASGPPKGADGESLRSLDLGALQNAVEH